MCFEILTCSPNRLGCGVDLLHILNQVAESASGPIQNRNHGSAPRPANNGKEETARKNHRATPLAQSKHAWKEEDFKEETQVALPYGKTQRDVDRRKHKGSPKKPATWKNGKKPTRKFDSTKGYPGEGPPKVDPWNARQRAKRKRVLRPGVATEEANPALKLKLQTFRECENGVQCMIAGHAHHVKKPLTGAPKRQAEKKGERHDRPKNYHTCDKVANCQCGGEFHAHNATETLTCQRTLDFIQTYTETEGAKDRSELHDQYMYTNEDWTDSTNPFAPLAGEEDDTRPDEAEEPGIVPKTGPTERRVLALTHLLPEPPPRRLPGGRSPLPIPYSRRKSHPRPCHSIRTSSFVARPAPARATCAGDMRI